MERKKGGQGRNRNVFKGSVLVSLLVESDPQRFPNRAAASKIGKKLFKDGQIYSIFGAKGFEDSAQLYVWHDDDIIRRGHGRNMTSPTTSSCSNPVISSHSPESAFHKPPDSKFIQDIKHKILNRSEAYNIVTSYNTFFQELEQDFGFDPQTHSPRKPQTAGSDVGWSGSVSNTPYTSTLELKKDTVYSTDSSLDTQTYAGRFPNRPGKKSKRTSLSPYPKSSSSKEASPHISHDTSPHLPQDHSNQHLQQSPQRLHPQHRHNNVHHHHHHHHQKQLKSYSNAVEMSSNKEPPVDSNSHPHITIGSSQERLSNVHTLSVEQGFSPHGNTAIDYDGSIPQGTVSSQVSSTVGDSTDTQLQTNSNQINPASSNMNHRWNQEPSSYSHHQSVTPGVSKWLDPVSANNAGNPNWGNDHLSRNRGDQGIDGGGGNRPRWPEIVVSDGLDSGRRWPEGTNSYSDNEKQLLEEMRRMKKEHQNVLRTYEGRINKLMAKMHELRNIAEMLENSSSKSSPYGMLPGKLALLNILGEKDLDDKKLMAIPMGSDTEQIPPPLPPRPGRGSKVYPNKPIIHTNVSMRPLPWSRIILEDSGEPANTIWHGMTEPKIDAEELQRLFSGSSDFSSDVNLYDDICLRRGRTKSQLVSIYDSERSQRINSELLALRCTLPEIIQAFVTLNCDELHTDSFAELLELLTSQRELDKIIHHVKRKGTGQFDAPEYLVYELSKVDHFRERLEFLRFKNKLQINLFEIDQQLRELHTACEEITTSLSLKHVLETVLAVGNHMNAGTERGQADGFRVDILNSLKDIQDPSKQGNLLELIMRIYCLKYESDLDFGCPTRFRLPEPSNMRHAAQVSFEDIHRALKELKDELAHVRSKLESLSKREGNTLTIALRVTSENFMTSAVEVLVDEQKLLEDTRIHFRKTASYFSMDGQKCTPHDFFQIWASFLHDCKYYWKLAHRNLAKTKFNTDLATKSQLSCSSLPGFNSLKSVMMKHVASFQQDEDMRVSKAQQLQHINSWIESVGRYTMEMQPEDVDMNPEFENGSHIPSRSPQSSQQPPDQLSAAPPAPHKYHLEQAASPPYKNQPAILSHSHKNNNASNFDRNVDKDTKYDERNIYPHHSKTNRDRESAQVPSSPKPIKATPPNVIKPQPIVHTSPTVSSPSPTGPSIQPLSSVPYPAEEATDTNNNKNAYGFQDDNFGFEPLYESLSRHAQDQPGFCDDSPEHAMMYPSDADGACPPQSPMSPDLDNAQKKNARFFKSLLKRDQKRSGTHDENHAHPHNSQHSALKTVSAPFNKLRNTVVQKLSSTGTSKKSHQDSPKIYESVTHNGNYETVPQPARREPLEQNPPGPLESPRDAGISRGMARNEDSGRHHPNYQNYYYPGQPRRADVPNIPEKSDDEIPPPYPEKTYRDGHDSIPSTISSLQSYRDPGQSKYQGNLLKPREASRDRLAGNDNKFRRDRNEDHRIPNSQGSEVSDSGHGPAKRSSKPRVREPIALGSNISISDVYGKSTDTASSHTLENVETCQLGDVNTGDHGSNSNIAVKPSNGSDPKWVKANAVPVYKAKLIPNYENQSKYDPRLEGGVRGQAEAAVQPKHVPQISISSEVYKQELQKKSEQYVGGGIYPTQGQTVQNSGSLRGTNLTGPTSYTVLPPRPNRYHASPIIISQNNNMISSATSTENVLNTNFHPSSLSPGTSHTYQQENPSQADSSPSQDRQRDSDSKPNFTLSPDGRLELRQDYNALSAERDLSRRQPREGPARRSSSAHNILEGGARYGQQEKKIHSAHASPGDFQHKKQSRVSRKDQAEKKLTASSKNEQMQNQNNAKVPPSVTSLIDRFEKKPADMHYLSVGLLDMDDKPPSMTSTPVSRRKNQGASATPSEPTARSSSSRRDGDSSRSQSEGSKRTWSETPEQHKDILSPLKNDSNQGQKYHHSSKSPHQAVAPFYVHPISVVQESSSLSQVPASSSSQPQVYQTPMSHRSQEGHQAENYQQTPHHHHNNSNHQQRQVFPNHSEGPAVNSTNKDVNLQLHDKYPTPNSRPSSHTSMRHTNSDRVLSSTDRGPGQTPTDQIQSDRSRSDSSKRSPYGSHSQGPSRNSHATPPASSSSSLQSGNYQSAFLPKPEPQYLNHHGPRESLQQQQQHSHRPADYHYPQQRQQHQPQQPQFLRVQPQMQSSESSNYPSPSQQHHHHGPSPQVNHNSPYSSEPPHSMSQPSNTNNNPVPHNTNTSTPDNRAYREELHRNSKSAPSAFERPLKSGPTFGRHPGAMAVVKPTVMNL